VLFAMYVACNPSIEKQCIPLSLKMVIEKWSSELWFEETDCLNEGPCHHRKASVIEKVDRKEVHPTIAQDRHREMKFRAMIWGCRLTAINICHLWSEENR
jgi:hypothetical protein